MQIHYCEGPADVHRLQGLGAALPGAPTRTVSSSGLRGCVSAQAGAVSPRLSNVAALLSWVRPVLWTAALLD